MFTIWITWHILLIRILLGGIYQMNKKSLLFTIFTTMLLTSLTIFAAQSYKVVVNGKALNCKTIVQDNTTYVPLRAITEALGANVNVSNGTITITTNKSEASGNVSPQPTTESKPSEVIVENTAKKDSGGVDPNKPVDPDKYIEDENGKFVSNPNYNPQRETTSHTAFD